MRIVSELLAPGGIVMISLRHGPDLAGRFHRVSADELIQHAHNRAEIPFGLVGLFWLKIYMPLVLTDNLIQTPKADHAQQRD